MEEIGGGNHQNSVSLYTVVNFEGNLEFGKLFWSYGG